MKKREDTLDGLKKKEDRFLEITALVIAVLSISIGFLAFSSQLKIKEELAHPDELNFYVTFSSKQNSVSRTPITPKIYPSNSDIEASKAVIENYNRPTIKHLDVKFTSPGQKVSYNFYVRNAGEYMAYLNSITYHNVASFNSPKICLTSDGKTNDQTKKACESIIVTVKIANIETSKTLLNIKNTNIRPMTSQPIEVTIEYLEGGFNPKQEFEVLFGDITLYYSNLPGHNEANNGNIEIS